MPPGVAIMASVESSTSVRQMMMRARSLLRVNFLARTHARVRTHTYTHKHKHPTNSHAPAEYELPHGLAAAPHDEGAGWWLGREGERGEAKSVLGLKLWA